jgi:hypothetical protein
MAGCGLFCKEVDNMSGKTAEGKLHARRADNNSMQAVADRIIEQLAQMETFIMI